MSSKCVVCTDQESQENKILRCEACSVRVHQMCYGVKTYEAKWKCAPCMAQASGSSNPICELCLQYGGAFKKTSDGNWAHVVCGLFIDGVEFVNKNRMEPINISKIPDEFRNKMCEFCYHNDGVCCLCADSNCSRWVHVTCAQRNGCTKEIPEKKGKITFRAYCENHTPSSRRISSIFVRDKLNEKCNNNQNHRFEPTTIQNSSSYERSVSGVDLLSTSSSHSVVSNASNSQNISGNSGDIEPTNLSNESIASNASNSQNISGNSGDTEPTNLSNESIASNASNSQNMSGNSGDTEPTNLDNQSIASNANSKSDFCDMSGMLSQYAMLSAIGIITTDNDSTRKHSNVSNIDYTDSNYTHNISDPVDTSTNETIQQNQYWWDHQDLLAQLHSKNKKITKLKEKKKKLKTQLNDLQDENTNLQMQIQKLNAKLQKVMPVTKHENVDACMVPNPLDDILKILEKRTTTQLADDGSNLIYPNGVEVEVNSPRLLEIIPSEESSDRRYINESFDIFFSEKYIKQQIQIGCATDQLLTQFRGTGQYELMKDLYALRVRRNGQGNVENRVQAFKTMYRTKLNNWIKKYEKSIKNPN